MKLKLKSLSACECEPAEKERRLEKERVTNWFFVLYWCYKLQREPMSVVNEATLSKYTHNERRTMKVAKKISENREPREGPKNAKLFLLFTPKKYTHTPK